MIDELAAYGIKAHLAPLPPQVHPPACVPPMPETFTVLLYVPRLRGEFYGKREYERLFRAFAGKPVRFLVVGGGQIQAPDDADVVQLGWRSDLPSIYEQTSVLLRFTKHDGLSLMVLEALSYGRHVVWSKDFPFARRATDYRECERALTAMLERHLAGELRPQADASAYVGKTYDRSQCIDRIAAYWDASINRAPVALDALEAAR
jgi:glycosyltransferase involved in cell wall biosynthesis